MTPIFTHKNTPSTSTTTTLSKLSLSQSHVVSRSCFLKSAKSSTTTIVPLKVSSTETPSAVDVPEEIPEAVEFEAADGTKDGQEEAKGEEVFAVVMIGGRQYIVFPGRFLYTQRLKGAAVDDKIILNKVLLVGTKTSTYIGKPVVPNAAVHAVVEEQGLDPKVVVFKYKKKKNYRRNIGHRQPNTRIRILGITGYQDSPATTLP